MTATSTTATVLLSDIVCETDKGLSTVPLVEERAFGLWQNDIPAQYRGLTASEITERIARAREALGSRAMAKQYFREAARIVNIPWSIAVGGDFAYPDTKGKKPFGTDVLNRYMDRVIQAGQVDDDVVIRLNEVLSLVRSPQALLAPSFVLRVLARARRADRARRDRHPAATSEPATTVDARAG